MSATTRHFELKAGGTTKFWSVEQRGALIDVKWGVVGGATKLHSRQQGDDAEARAKIDEMIAARQKEGYVEVSDPRAVIATIKEERWARRFEDGRRFWEIILDARRVQQRRGPLEADEYERETIELFEHPTIEDAREIVERIIKRATKQDGYVLVRETDPPPIAMPGRMVLIANPELEAQCLADPENADTWAVYADWLMSHDDPRGELAALRVKGKETEAGAMFRANRLGLFGQHGALVSAARITRWRHGFATGVGIKLKPDTSDVVTLDELAKVLLGSPIGAFVESLRFGLAGFASDNDWEPTIDAIACAKQAGRIRELRFDDFDANDSEISWVQFGDFSKAWSKLPALERLHIRSGGGGVLGTIVLPNLRTFVRESGGLQATEIASICDATWPRLEHLEIWFGAAAHGAEGSVQSIRKILDGIGLPSLKHLGLCNCEFVDTLIGALAESKILTQLRTLDLSKGLMARAATRAMVEHAAAFRHLASIDLSENVLLVAEVRQIAAMLPNVVATDQRDRDDFDEDDEDQDDGRYVAVGE